MRLLHRAGFFLFELIFGYIGKGSGGNTLALLFHVPWHVWHGWLSNAFNRRWARVHPRLSDPGCFALCGGVSNRSRWHTETKQLGGMRTKPA